MPARCCRPCNRLCRQRSPFFARRLRIGVKSAGEQKFKKDVSGPPQLELAENPDILATIAQAKTNRPALVIGFAAETEQVIDYAQAKRRKKQCDWIVANDVSDDVFGAEGNAVTLISPSG